MQVERTNADIELALNKLKTEEASLRDQLAKMQALNEGLAQDKVDLHKVIAEVKKSLTNRKELFCLLQLIDIYRSPLYVIDTTSNVCCR